MLENAEEEIRQLKGKLAEASNGRGPGDGNPIVQWTANDAALKKGVSPSKTGGLAGAGGNSNAATAASVASIGRELEDAQAKMEQQSLLVKQLKEQAQRSETQYTEQQALVQNLESELEGSREQVSKLNAIKSDLTKQLEAAIRAEKLANRMAATAGAAPVDVNVLSLQGQLASAEAEIRLLEEQLVASANEASWQFSEQQLQIQGMEVLIEQIRQSYDEFVQATKIESEVHRESQQHEYETLKRTFEQYKKDVFEEKRLLLLEYQTLIQTMQTQFDEFRATSEYLFSTELLRIEDEMAVQAARYEQEITFITQSKDRFYADLMVAKDAKLMNLLAGADMQLLMQQHEAEIDQLRREQSKEIERVKANQDSEHKNIISLIQRQNQSLEAKSERFQQHIRSLENKIRDLTDAIENKNRQIASKDEAQARLEEEQRVKVDELYHKINALTQAKEQLRHRIIRFKMDAKGDGQNTVDLMLSRLSKDASQLQGEFVALSGRYKESMAENERLEKLKKESKRTVEFLEAELLKRNKEYSAMTDIFEQFLRIKTKFATGAQRSPSALNTEGDGDKRLSLSANRGPSDPKHLSLSGSTSSTPRASTSNSTLLDKQSRVAIERGYAYLKKFKALSRVYASGDFRATAVGNVNPNQISSRNAGFEDENIVDKESGVSEVVSYSTNPTSWKNMPIYKRLDEANRQMAKFYSSTATVLPPPISKEVADEDFEATVIPATRKVSRYIKPTTPSNLASLYYNPDEVLPLEKAFLMLESTTVTPAKNLQTLKKK